MIQKTDDGHVVVDKKGHQIGPAHPTRGHAEVAEHNEVMKRGPEFYKKGDNPVPSGFGSPPAPVIAQPQTGGGYPVNG